MQVSRWCYRCKDCLSVGFFDEELERTSIYSYGTCAVCQGKVELMGRVQSDRLVQDELRCPCDLRCTNAKGPNCDCRCKGANHGSMMLIPVIRDAGPVPIVVFLPEADARTNAAEWREAEKELVAQIDTINDKRDEKNWLGNGDYLMYLKKAKALQTARDNRTHEARMRNVRAGLELGTKVISG